ncbi:MAG: hypothetical protein IT198_17750 [Acidimicrobiia bacterium]|nr:hypothetical protein [Acidimicrobiia bacterium]
MTQVLSRPVPDSTSQPGPPPRRRGRRLPFVLAGASILILAVTLAVVTLLSTDTTSDEAGIESMLSRVSLGGSAGPEATIPRYVVDATVDPGTGQVHARLEVERVGAVTDDGAVTFRVLSAAATATAIEVRVDGRRVDTDLSETTLRVPAPAGTESIRLDVDYVLPELPEPTPADLLADLVPGLGEDEGDEELASSLLGRSEDRVLLGHWLPVAITPGGEAGADLGMGDIGNFPAADWAARVRLPPGWELTTNATSVESAPEGDLVAFGEAGRSLRDLSGVAGRDLAAVTVDAGGVTVRAWAEAGRADEAAEAARIAAGALSYFDARWGAYPWPELDVVATPLPLSVGGVEWSGSVWIAADIFAGGIPGGGEWSDELGDILALGEGAAGLVEGPLGEIVRELVGALRLVRDFTIAHEVAHQWWYGIVGSDQITTAAIDEPLAQYGACRFLVDAEGDTGQTACDANTDLAYVTMRVLGDADAPVDQPTTEFETFTSYGGIVYGKGPGFWQALESEAGAEAVDAALAAVTREHAQAIVTQEEFVATLADSMEGHSDETGALWTHWMEETHGDADIGGPEGILGGALSTVSELLGALRSGDIAFLLELLGTL